MAKSSNKLKALSYIAPPVTHVWNDALNPEVLKLLPSELQGHMSNNQYRWCLEMLANGMNEKAAALTVGCPAQHVTGFLKRAHDNEFVQAYLTNMHCTLEERVEITLEWKYKKIKQIIDICMPDNTKLYNRDTMAPTVALAAIAELNKMQGHYAVTKAENSFTIPRDELDTLKDLVHQMALEHQRDY